MSTNTLVYLRALNYSLGEIDVEHTELDGLTERADALGIPRQPDVLGWGRVRRTERDLAQLAVDSGAATLDAAGAGPEDVDAVVLCSNQFPSGAETHGELVRAVLTGLGTPTAAFFGVTLDRCANLLSALRVAAALVAAGVHRGVLVITTDRVADESARLAHFALFSDGAASCLVGPDAVGADYRVVASARAQETAELDYTHEISSDLARRVNTDLLDPLGLDLAELDGLSHTNLFVPLVVLKERQAGFAQRQLYTDNITRFGHCFAADPLINLVDRTARAPLAAGAHHLLAASVPGVRVGVLLEKR